MLAVSFVDGSFLRSAIIAEAPSASISPLTLMPCWCNCVMSFCLLLHTLTRYCFASGSVGASGCGLHVLREPLLVSTIAFAMFFAFIQFGQLAFCQPLLKLPIGFRFNPLEFFADVHMTPATAIFQPHWEPRRAVLITDDPERQ